MKNMKPTLSLTATAVAIVLASSVFVACGGGGDSSNSSGDTPNKNTNNPAAARNALQADAINDQIRPAFANAHTAAKALNKSATAFCANKTAANFAALKTKWQDTAKSWAATEIYDTSKLSATDVRDALYINYYPDDNKLTKKRLDALLSDSTTLNTAWATESPVTNVGISAIEYIIYADNLKLADVTQRRCEMLTAQTNLLENDITRYDTLWQGVYGNDFKNNTGFFSSEGSALSVWYNSSLNLLEIMKDRKLGNPATLSTGAKKGHYEARHANMSKALYTSNFNAVSRALVGDDKNGGFVGYLQAIGTTSLADKIKNQVTAVKTALNDITEASFADTSAAKRQALFNAMKALTYTVKNDVSATANIQVTFNSNDGD